MEISLKNISLKKTNLSFFNQTTLNPARLSRTDRHIQRMDIRESILQKTYFYNILPYKVSMVPRDKNITTEVQYSRVTKILNKILSNVIV